MKEKILSNFWFSYFFYFEWVSSKRYNSRKSSWRKNSCQVFDFHNCFISSKSPLRYTFEFCNFDSPEVHDKETCQIFVSLIFIINLDRDYCRMDWNSFAFFSKLKPYELAKYGSNMIWASSKNTQFLKIWRVYFKN